MTFVIWPRKTKGMCIEVNYEHLTATRSSDINLKRGKALSWLNYTLWIYKEIRIKKYLNKAFSNKIKY